MPNNKERVKSYPRLSHKEFIILEMLIAKRMYGLEMVDASDGDLKRGTIYVTLGRMEEKGFVESYIEPRSQPEIGIPRRIYKTTGLGEEVFRAQQIAIEAINLNFTFGGIK